MLTPSDISAQTVHDLWIDARQFTIGISRPTSTSIKLTIARPATLTAADGAVVLLSDRPITAVNYPDDGITYSADAAPDWTQPVQTIQGAQVVGAYYNALNRPFPITETTEASATVTGFPATFQTFSITVNNTDPNKIYYASVHAASNVLQYYPIGVQSYPLEGANVERGTSSYTGNIPSYPTAPTAPSPGMVYHDQQLNIIQYYDGVTGSWVPTRSDSIVSGPYNPGVLGQVYLYVTNLKIFNGKSWVDATSANLQLRTGATWAPFAQLSLATEPPDQPAVAEMYYDYTLERLHYWDGAAWAYPNASTALFNTGTTLVPAFITPITVESELLSPPYVGQLFYNTTSKQLNAWNGVSWNKVNTDQEGAASTDKISVGTDGTYDARIALIKVLNGQLGWPQLCVELQEEQFNIAIDNALDNYRALSSNAYKRGYVLYTLIPGQQKYYLNSAIDKTDHIVDVHKIHRLGPLGIYNGAGPQDVWAQAFAQEFYDFAAGGADLVSTHLIASFGEELQRLFAGDLMFQWDEPTHELVILRAVRAYEKVVIEAELERSEQEILTDRYARQYIQNWSLAELKMMLGLIRSKFASGTPGPAGTINLNGELLIAEARQDMIELKEELLNYEYGGPAGWGNCSVIFG